MTRAEKAWLRLALITTLVLAAAQLLYTGHP